MMYKSCIFDLDGTLTDTLDSLTFSVNLTMKEMGLPEITREQCRMFVGNGSRVLLEKALRAASEEAFENFLTFVRMLTDEHGLHISQRNLTVSTCGIVPKIRELAMEHLQITLALSLHGSTQEKRKQLMPVANKYDLQEVLKACDFYFQETGRRVTFEYSLVHGVNDTQEDAEELIRILKSRNCHLNLIPVNPIKERDFQQPSRKNALNFKNKLEKSGINVTIRREMGADIDGACGQLRRRYVKTENE